VSAFGRRLGLIAAGALALRLIYLAVLARHVGGAGDYHFYDSTANLIADGRFFTDPFRLAADGVATPTAAHPPLWPLLLSVSSLLGATGETAHKLVGCLVGTGVVGLIGLLGRRIGGDRLGLAAAAIAAVYPVLVAADASLMSEPLYGLFIALAMLAGLRLAERPTAGRAAVLGVVIGLAALTRSEGLLLLLLLAAPLAVRAPVPRRARAGMLIAAVAAALLVIAPWTARNWAVFDQPVLISNNDGTLLAGANCPASYSGALLGGWSFDCISTALPADDEAERSDRWRREGIDYAREHASRWPVVVPVRVLRTLDLYQPLEQAQFAEGRDRTVDRIGVLCFFALVPLAALGLLALRGRAPLIVLLAPLALVLLTSALGYGIPRLRHAAELPLVILAAAGLLALWDRYAASPSPAATSSPARASADSVTAGSSQSQSKPA
jgi:4-amino-4-deoxy-L-arabinose transferase-like glycosyltransferase